MANNPELNRVAIWQPQIAKGLTVRSYESYVYLERGVVKSAKQLNQIVIRCAKNYKRNKQEFSLLIITLEPDTKKIEKFLNDTAKKVKLNDIDKNLRYTEFYYDPS